LFGHGKPANTGNDQFRIVYGTSICTASVSVLNGANLASFTLEGAPNSCIIDTLIGGYIKGIAADTSSHVIIAVNVTTPGTIFCKYEFGKWLQFFQFRDIFRLQVYKPFHWLRQVLLSMPVPMCLL
jgi:hypothetical protein